MEPELKTLEPIAVRRGTAAKMLEVSVTTVWHMCRRGDLATIKIGADDRILVDSIRRFAAAKKAV
ncbi:MAG: helix-turn-helix domain-containing protein [Burkholderiales bacterium]